ncbi:MAG: hypothetical protein GX945_13125 [Lentisphaerae bacterium]|nr:hypothetical protein [Lentisphaerota bacterium]
MKHCSTFGMLMVSLLVASAFAAETVTLFDFRGSQSHGWRGNPRVESITPGPEGLHVVCSGAEDPWIEGPPCELLPDGEYEMLKLELTFANRGATSIEVFYGPRFVADKSVRLAATGDGAWQSSSALIPRLRPGDRLRIDPAQYEGEFTLAGIKVTPLIPLFNTDFSKPETPQVEQLTQTLSAGELILRHHPQRWGDFILERKGRRLASGQANDAIVVLNAVGQVACIALNELELNWERQGNALRCTASHQDADGRTWRISRSFQAQYGNAIAIHTSIRLSAAADIVNVPWLTLFPGLGSYGSAKDQAIFAGVEYLMDEASSDTKDVRGPNAIRRLVSNHKICFPLMAILQDRQWLALSWDESQKPGPIFDSPDRIHNSGAHLFALWSPGVCQGRIENDFNVYEPMRWDGERDYGMTTVVSAGDGHSVIDAVKDYLQRNQLPPLPEYAAGYQAALALLAAGWLDSSSYNDGKWRHAVVPDPKNFAAQPAADALVFLAWIASETTDTALAARIRERLAELLPKYAELGYSSGVSHGRQELFVQMYFNRALSWLDRAAGGARDALTKLRPDGSSPYVASATAKHDYGVTHWTDHANGLTANRLILPVHYAQAAGDPAFRADFLAAVDRVLDLYRYDAPRGAQTWEIALHTPDILGAAYMLKLCVAAYRVSADEKYLREAEYWALSGVPFVYLIDPVLEHGPLGRYGTIAVLGATSWRAPFWIGLPVQWCGLVYRNELLHYLTELPDREKQKFWQQLANGITIAGLQMTYPLSNNALQGLLPDYFILARQHGGGPAINPGTVLHGFPQAFGKAAIFGTKAVAPGIVVHALGAISNWQDANGRRELELTLWPEGPSEVVISGLGKEPAALHWQGKPVTAQWSEKHQTLIVSLSGKGRLTLE